jgi:superfamily II DNA helicase RecQ
VSTFLSDQGIKAKPFHRGVKQSELDKTLTEWIIGKVDCVVATIAFGMVSQAVAAEREDG